MSDRAVVAVTGANGYVGSILCSALQRAGHRVIRLQRSCPADIDSQHNIQYSLESGPAQPLPSDVSAVIHCAYDLRLRNEKEIHRVNLGGFTNLVGAVGQRLLIHISSMSAYDGTEQIYGKTKLACEDLASRQGGISLRLGLVYGASGGGMIGSLTKLATLPLVPQLRPQTYQYTVHADDMARCVLSVLGQRPPHQVIGVADPARVPFDEIMGSLRESATSKAAVRVPVPSRRILQALRAAEAAHLPIGFRADSMLGLMHPAPAVPNVEYWATRAISFRRFG